MNKKNLLKITFFTFMLFATLVNVFGSKAQAFNSKVSLSFQNAAIKEVLTSIKNQTGYDFVYNADDIDSSKRISVEVTDADLRTALNKCFDASGISFSFQGNIIVLKKQESPLEQQPPAQEKKKIKGYVIDEYGKPLPGVSIVVKGSQQGVASEIDGTFSIAVPYEKSITLIFSFIGMKKQNIKVSDFDTELKVTMKEDVSVLKDVVVTGMQVIKKEKMTGSATVVTAKDIKEHGITGIDRILTHIIHQKVA